VFFCFETLFIQRFISFCTSTYKKSISIKTKTEKSNVLGQLSSR